MVTLPEMDHALTLPPRDKERLYHTMMSAQTAQLNSRLPSLSPQSQLLLRPTRWPSRDTPEESLPQDAEPPSITESSLLVTELTPPPETTSLSRTHGVLHGELTDTSTSVLVPATFAESSPLPHIQLSETQVVRESVHVSNYLISKTNKFLFSVSIILNI